jgi:hypothetical protein
MLWLGVYRQQTYLFLYTAQQIQEIYRIQGTFELGINNRASFTNKKS